MGVVHACGSEGRSCYQEYISDQSAKVMGVSVKLGETYVIKLKTTGLSILSMEYSNLCIQGKKNCCYFTFQKFERRGRHVTEEEKAKWKDIHPTMMSDEEDCEGKFKIHRQEWRSSEFNSFMNILDDRAAKASSHPRKERFNGTPLKCDQPSGVASWMVDSPESPAY